MTQRSSKFLALAFGLVLGPSGVSAGKGVELAVTLTPAGSFTAKTAAIAVKGGVTRNGDAWSLKDAVVDLKTLKTGIELRDEHMTNKYLETGKYPQAVLKSAAGQDGKFKGELLVHGVTKPVEGTYEFQGNELVAKFNVRASDFKIAKAKYMGVGVEDDVEVKAALPLPVAKR